MYAKTVFILNYDENGGFADVHWPPMAPASPEEGASTVSTVGEIFHNKTLSGVDAPTAIGMGFRVPLVIVSPWTRGGRVFSQVSDHTSVIQFLEKRFGVICPNISPWRRAVASDLVAAFDFDHPDYSWPTSFPDTTHNVRDSEYQCEHLPMPQVPAVQRMPVQEPGTVPSLPLPYEFSVECSVSPAAATATMTIINTGNATGAFQVHDRRNPTAAPRRYTVEPGKQLSGVWPLTADEDSSDTAYELHLHGPNGFVRKCAGTLATAGVSVLLHYSPADDAVVVAAIGLGGAGAPASLVVTDNAYKQGGPWSLTAGTAQAKINVGGSGGWYDLSVRVPGQTPGSPGTFFRRFMGRMETGKMSITDPAMGDSARRAFVAAWPHPTTPQHLMDIPRLDVEKVCATHRGAYKDMCWRYRKHDEL